MKALITGASSGIGRDMAKILNVDVLPTNSYCKWGSFYTIINYCNTLLYYAPGVCKVDQDFTQADMTKLRNAGYKGVPTPIENAVKDYVGNYLTKDFPYLQ